MPSIFGIWSDIRCFIAVVVPRVLTDCRFLLLIISIQFQVSVSTIDFSRAAMSRSSTVMRQKEQTLEIAFVYGKVNLAKYIVSGSWLKMRLFPSSLDAVLQWRVTARGPTWKKETNINNWSKSRQLFVLRYHVYTLNLVAISSVLSGRQIITVRAFCSNISWTNVRPTPAISSIVTLLIFCK